MRWWLVEVHIQMDGGDGGGDDRKWPGLNQATYFLKNELRQQEMNARA